MTHDEKIAVITHHKNGMNTSYRVYEVKEDKVYISSVQPQTTLYEVGGYNSTLREAEDHVAMQLKHSPYKQYTILPIYQH
jgi:hypothetical protein